MQLNQSVLRLFLRQVMFLHDRRDADGDFRIAKDLLELDGMHLEMQHTLFFTYTPTILWRM